MKRTVPERTELCCEAVEVRMSGEAINLAELRARFSELFDRAAARVQREGFDLDDVVVDRFMVCRAEGGDEVEAAMEFLSSAEAVRDQVRRVVSRATGSDQASPQIVRAGVRVWLERPV